MATTWNGALNANEIFTSIFNMIIGQEVFADNIGSMFTSLVDRARIDGTMLGDTYLKYSTDALQTTEFDPTNAGGRQANVLEQFRPKDPFVQAITIDVFRQIPVTIDHYFTKRAFSTESAFADFNSVTLQWLRDTKRIYDATTYNAFVGTETSEDGIAYDDGGSMRYATQTLNIPAYTSGTNTPVDVESRRRINAQNVAREVADLLVKLRDVSKDYNDLGYYRALNLDDLEIIWNADWVNEIRKVDLPTIFNKDGLFEIKEENVLPAKYFGVRANSDDASKFSTESSSVTRALHEIDATYNGQPVHYWAGEIIPSEDGAVLVPGITPADFYYEASAASTDAASPTASIVCKIIHKRSIPYMSGFETETEFINPRLLNENHYLTFGHNTLQHLYNYPMITVTYNWQL